MKLLNMVVAVWKLVAKYPALSAGLSQVIILIAAQLGLSLTTTQLASVAGVVATLFAVAVSAGVIPVTKVANVKAGLKPTVPVNVVVATPEVAAKMPVDLPYTPTQPNPIVVAETARVSAGTVNVTGDVATPTGSVWPTHRKDA